MNKRTLFFAAASIFVTAAHSEPTVTATMPGDVKWEESPFPGVEKTVISGNQAGPGLYVSRTKFAPASKIGPHTHPDTRQATVLSGELYFGFGETFDTSKAKRYPAGAQITVPANTPHFLWATDREAILQEVGVGPSGMTMLKK